jgi:hypothetical protein
MKFLKCSIRFALRQITEGLILIYQHSPSEEFKNSLLDFILIKEDIECHLKTIKKK